MSQSIRAIYEGGHLRLLDPVELAEGAEVRVVFLSKRDELRATLGHLFVPAPEPPEDFDDEEARRQIDEALRAAGYPNASGYIIEERREGP